MNVVIKRNGLYLLSGPAGAGKTTFILNNPKISPEMVISKDALRRQVFGVEPKLVDGAVVQTPATYNERAVAQLVESMVEMRLSAGLPTFVDATLLTDKDRRSFISLAKRYGAPVYIFIFDLPAAQVLSQNRGRLALAEAGSDHLPIPDAAVRQQLEIFQRDSELADYVRIGPGTNLQVSFEPGKVLCEKGRKLKLDVIGDTHGLYDETLALIQRLGYEVTESSGRVRVQHPAGRKLLLLGDFCDRGPGDLEMIMLAQGLRGDEHYVIRGNHETKLLLALSGYLQSQTVESNSVATSKVMARLLQQEPRVQQAILTFLKSLPPYLTVKDYFFCHAPVSHVDLLRTPDDHLIYGGRFQNPETVHRDYDTLYETGHNQHILIHGHVPHQDNSSRYIFSLDNHVGCGGDIQALRLDEFDRQRRELGHCRLAFDRCRLVQKSGFDIYQSMPQGLKNYMSIIQHARRNKGKGALFLVNPGPQGMTLIKYTPTVHFQNRWHEHPMLMKARGLVLDCGGNIIQHVFDKVFNVNENGTGGDLSPDTPVVATENLNGFFAAMTAHPYNKGRLLTTTTGSFDSPFIEYVRQSITAEEQKGMLRFHGRHPDITLMYEVLHPDDPHIVSYPKERMGVYLIGARRKGWDDQPMTEAELDRIAGEIGVRRAVWSRMTLGEALERNKVCEDEGYMVRLDTPSQPTVMKLKSPLYLRTKFLGRLSDEKSALMFQHLPSFCKNLEEEGRMLAETLVSRYSLDQWQDMSDTDRIATISGLIAAQVSVPAAAEPSEEAASALQ